jgi:F420-dependent oxidoreductase-like protein
MDFRIFTEPQQGATHAQLLAVAQKAEELGFDGFFRSDHYLFMGEVDPKPGPSDAWTTLAALAVQTHKLRIGTLMTSATFRLPGPFAVIVNQVDQMSMGRVEVGIGAGWYDPEHRALGIPFPPTKERFDRLEEQLEILELFWSTPEGERFDFEGANYKLQECLALPRAVQQPHPPVIIGGFGPKRTAGLAAKHAAEFNAPFVSAEQSADLYRHVDEVCEDMGRDPRTLCKSAALVTCCGTTEEEFTKRASAIGRDPAELRKNGLAGLPKEVVSSVQRYAEAGATRFYLQILDLDDLEHLELLASVLLESF